MLIGQKIDFVHDEVQGETKQGEEENLVKNYTAACLQTLD